MTLPLGVKSALLLSQCHPDLKTLFIEVNENIQCTILPSTIRTHEQQVEFVRQGLSQTMNSKHLTQADGFSHAVDVAPDPVNFERANFNLDLAYFAGYVMATAERLKKEGKIKSDIRYGGDWNVNNRISDERFKDLDHFEIV